MIGIYKITNKLNNRSYIGQSIHCCQRLDQHFEGNDQFIDCTIQMEGIENFTFEILKKVDRNELNFWEDYYIMKYNTMLPNGYNRRWNCSEEIRKKIKKMIEQEQEEGKFNNPSEKYYQKDFEEQEPEEDEKDRIAGELWERIEYYDGTISIMTDKKDVSENSQRLLNYLIGLAYEKNKDNKRKLFQHDDIRLETIHRTIDISVPSLKKYWFELEENKKIIYGNDKILPAAEQKLKNAYLKGRKWKDLSKEQQFEIWKELWKERKTRKKEYYEIVIGSDYMNMPRNTIELMNRAIKMSEQDIKIYQYLLPCRNILSKSNKEDCVFTAQDLREFLNKEQDQRTNLSIYRSLGKLKEYGLIDYEEDYRSNEKGAKIKNYIITNVSLNLSPEYINSSEQERRSFELAVKLRLERKMF